MIFTLLVSINIVNFKISSECTFINQTRIKIKENKKLLCYLVKNFCHFVVFVKSDLIAIVDFVGFSSFIHKRQISQIQTWKKSNVLTKQFFRLLYLLFNECEVVWITMYKKTNEICTKKWNTGQLYILQTLSIIFPVSCLWEERLQFFKLLKMRSWYELYKVFYQFKEKMRLELKTKHEFEFNSRMSWGTLQLFWSRNTAQFSRPAKIAIHVVKFLSL